MKSLVVYDSQFGNTKTIAEIIGTALETNGPTRVVSVETVTEEDLGSLDLLVVGAPTQAHGMRPGMRPFLEGLRALPATSALAAAFDTRLRGPEFIWGSAAHTIAHDLRRADLKLIAEPESFFVTMGKTPELERGEAERARAWAVELGARVASGQPV
ncbi:MAG TPA: flavodoxin domain-containing protein [Candidatus Limnocylindrales bacterium]|nr:flavodoxin domain-containing protein [Candidatus Limnocylindrales bacterium]